MRNKKQKHSRHKRRKSHKNKIRRKPSKNNFRLKYTTKWILYSILFLIISLFISNFVSELEQPLNKILMWVFVIISLYIYGKTTKLALKKINRLNLKSDLTIWILRIIAIAIISLGTYFLIVFLILSLLTDHAEIAFYSLTFFTICLIIISAFAIYRVKRRHRLVGVWR